MKWAMRLKLWEKKETDKSQPGPDMFARIFYGMLRLKRRYFADDDDDDGDDDETRFKSSPFNKG
jgi:hypothetical protein